MELTFEECGARITFYIEDGRLKARAENLTPEEEECLKRLLAGEECPTHGTRFVRESYKKARQKLLGD